MSSPERIGPYLIERLLGTGAFATVWLAHDPVLDSPVAIKVLAENWHHDLRVRERFLDEARLLRRLDDERLVRVHAAGELADGRPYSVMAWADGGSLRDRLAAGPMPAPAALDLLAEIAAGVAVLHRHGVVHRDLTPGNVLFRSGPDGERVLIADLGLAKALAAASGLTARAGTPGYMAPEQDDPLAVVDTRTDVYGLGRLGLRLLGPDAERVAGGQPPPDQLSPDGAIRLREGVPTQVAAVLRRAIAPRPADRHPDATAFRTALRHATTAPARPDPARSAAGSPCAPAGPSPRVGDRPAGRRRFGAVGLGVAALVAVGATAGDAAPAGRAAGTWTSGPVTVALPPGWRATGTGWAGQYGDDGRLEPALVMSPDPRRWAADPTVPGAFVGLSASIAARTTPAGFVAERPHSACAAAPVRRTRQGGVDWVVARFTCDQGRPEVVEVAGLAPGRVGLIYVQVVPPAGEGPGFVDTLLAGVRVR
ncbi:protein kinase [Micromonospora peucetia]|uniref:non-specific serine/threonine protein kinase n=1 Tax=Micromonospora peucetia TaxID=47871 RepID=A0A1C6W5M6_9ACTN|nr:serine/threonine-protein kinase [Micromonospora peucetia]MCX4385446.1 protein kinase [Micromonospora peucetia]WSA32840.1 protein kinase [Micromonospora peucetia]SCL73843.1 Serine/threonine protein kinase [Micromonospora peucetia]